MALGNTWTNIASKSVYVAPATITFYIDAKLNRQDISGNYSVVDTRLTSTISGSAAGSGYRFTLTGSNGISGDAVWYFGNETILTGQTTIYHNDDGTKVGSASAYCYNRYLGISVDFSGSFDLPTIARASEPTISPSSTFNIGDTITINTNRKSNSFTHTLSLSFGSYSYQIGTNVGASTTLNTSTIANNLYQQIPNANSGTGTITCITYNGSTQVGTKSVSFTAKVVNSNPTFNQAYLDTNSTTTTITQNNQQIIRNKSTLQINITSASAKNYSTLSSSKVVINGITYNGTFSGSSSTINVGTINVSSNTTAKVSVTDSRGNTTTKDLAITILDWVQPSAIIKLERESNYYSTTNINVNAEYSSLSNKNTISIKVREKKTTESTWGAYTTLNDDVTSQLDLDNQYAWNVQVVLEDRLATTTYNLVLDRGIPLIFFDREKRSVGINKFPQHNSSLEVDGDLYNNSLDLFNDTSGSTLKEMMKNKIDYCINNVGTNKSNFQVFINGGWSGRMFGFGLFSKIGSFYQLTWTCEQGTYYIMKNGSNYSVRGTGFEYNSSNEIIVGVWTNGKPVYRKVFTATGDGNNTQKLFTQNDIEDIVSFNGWATKNNVTRNLNTCFYGSLDWASQFYFGNGNGNIECGNTFKAFKNGASLHAVVEYTKTTD